MEFLGLSLFQFLAVAAAGSALVVALYYLDRKRRRVRVSSFRFWNDARIERHPLPQHRIQQPWSLLLQVLALLCLLAALADVRWRGDRFQPLDHVLVLDASSAMLARDGGRPLLDRVKDLAVRYARSLPPGDRVMVVPSDGMPRPSSSFEEDAEVVEASIGAATPGSTALNLGEALSFAKQMLQRSQAPGDIIYVGGLWLAGSEAPAIVGELDNLRVIPVETPVSNVSLEKIVLKASEADPGLWTAYISLANRGAAQNVPIQIAFGGAPIASARAALSADAVVTLPVEFRSGASGWVDIRLAVADSIQADNSARVELPRSGGARIQICTQARAPFEALVKAYPSWRAEFSAASPCPVSEGADLVVLDRVAPAAPLTVPALWIEPAESPAWRSHRISAKQPAVSWNTASAMSSGLRAKDVALTNIQVFSPATADEVVASVAEGPIALARRGAVPQVAWGFHPLLSDMRYEVTAPLLFANTFRWLAAAAALPEEINVGAAGSVLLADLDSEGSGDLTILDSRGTALPVTHGKDGWRFFAGATGLYRARQGHRESIVSLNLPETPGVKWTPPKEKTLAGIPAGSDVAPPARWWPWLAAMGLLLLLADAALFDRRGSAESAPARNPFARLLRRLGLKGAGIRHGI